MKNINFQAIGHVVSTFSDPLDMPIQPSSNYSIPGQLVVYQEFADGLHGLSEFSHLVLLYHLHKVTKSSLLVKPFLDNKKHGIFATRAPVRPNAIGMSVLEIEKIDENIIYIKNIDILNNTPIIDIKPLVPDFDFPKNTEIKVGWYSNSESNVATKKSDARF